MSDRVHVEPKLLLWARDRARKSDEELEGKFASFPQWVTGEANPTMKQLERFAALTYTPLGYFFLSEPPEERLPIPDFRTVADRPVERPSPHLLDTVHAVQLRQEWMRGFLIEQGEEPLAFVGSRTVRDDPEEVAGEIRRTLGLEPHWSREYRSWEDALRVLIQHIEGAGVLVMINGVVENNTHRPLDVAEFRGFVLSDAYAPAIFVNGTDARGAQMFTLVHELVHVWLGKGGVSGLDEMLPSDNEVEVFCNRVAAEFLVPAREMREIWPEAEGRGEPFKWLARVFKVSPIVTARRALDLALITRAAYFHFYNAYRAQVAALKTGGGGGNFYLTLGVRLGKRFPAAVFSAAKEGRLPYREAYQLTGLNSANYDRFGREFGFAV